MRPNIGMSLGQRDKLDKQSVLTSLKVLLTPLIFKRTTPRIGTSKLTINRLFIWESDLNKTQKQRILRPYGCTYKMSFAQTKQTIMAVSSGGKGTNASKRVIRLNVYCGSPGFHRAFKTNSFKVSSRHQCWS